jgi:hypothetical protein
VVVGPARPASGIAVAFGADPLVTDAVSHAGSGPGETQVPQVPRRWRLATSSAWARLYQMTSERRVAVTTPPAPPPLVALGLPQQHERRESPGPCFRTSGCLRMSPPEALTVAATVAAPAASSGV